MTIFGTGIASTVQGVVRASFLEIGLPLTLSDVSVTFDATPAPIFNVANVNGQQQVTVQAPCQLAGQSTTSITIKSGGSTTVSGIQVLAVQPGVFESDLGTGRKVAILLRPDGSLVTAANPALRGEVIRMFATGLGLVAPASNTNRAGVGGQTVVSPLVVGVNDLGVEIVSTELATNMIGVYIVAFRIPLDATTGINRNLALAAVRSDGVFVFGNGSAVAVIQ